MSCNDMQCKLYYDVIWLDNMYTHMSRMSGGQIYLLPGMNMAKVDGALSVVKVCTSALCAKKGYR